MPEASQAPLLSIRGLCTQFVSDGAVVQAVDGVDLDIAAGETVGLVGESGCGKSTIALSIMGLLPPGQGRVAAGAIRFEGRDLAALAPDALRRLRGDRMAMIFQEPMTSLNPVLTIGRQVAESLETHRGMTRRPARAAAVELLAAVGIPAPAERAGDYPHRLSGGMRQRVMIAIAMACRPGLLIADEPTTALDVTIQAQILELIDGLKRDTGMAVLLITHNLGIVAEMAARVAVMYAGRIVEEGPTAEIFARPTHPYTRGLIESIPRLGERRRRGRRRLQEIPGLVPSLAVRRPGCAFAPRCPARIARCAVEAPEPSSIAAAHRLRCHVHGVPA